MSTQTSSGTGSNSQLSQRASNSQFSEDVMMHDTEEMDDFDGDFNDIWSGIRDSIEYGSVDDLQNILESIERSLMNGLKFAAIDDLESAVLAKAMPTAKYFMDKCFDESFKTLPAKDNPVKAINTLLQLLTDFLSCISSCAHFLISLEKIPASRLKSFLLVGGEIIRELFKHCRKSDYNELVPEVKDKLTNLFKMNCELRFKYFIIVDEISTYNYDCEEDVAILKSVIALQSSIGLEIISLDIKTMAAQWKGYMKLITDHYSKINNVDFDEAIYFLTEEIKRSLQKVFDSEKKNDKNIITTIKVDSFLLKVITKIVDVAIENLSENSHRELFLLILELCGFAPFVLVKYSPLKDETIDVINKHIFVFVEPLIAILQQQCHFTNAFFKHQKSIQCETTRLASRPNHLLFNILLLQKISPDNKFWFRNDITNNFICTVFAHLRNAHKILSNGFTMPALDSKNSSFGVYEMHLVAIANVILALDADQFSFLERVMFEMVVEHNPWMSLFAVDLWCCLSRFSSDQLCLDQVKFLIKFDQRKKPKSIYLRLLIRRLFSLLNVDDQVEVFVDFPPNDYQIWCEIDFAFVHERISHSFLPIAQSGMARCSEMLCGNGDDSEIVKKIWYLAKLTTNMYKAKRLKEMPSCGQFVMDLWKCVNCGGIFKNDVLDCMESISQLTESVILDFTESETITLLEIFRQLPKCPYKFYILNIIRHLGGKEFHGQKTIILDLIVNLYRELMLDENAVIKQMAFDSFEDFSLNPIHEHAIMEIINTNEELKMDLHKYVTRETDGLHFTVDFNTYLDAQECYLREGMKKVIINEPLRDHTKYENKRLPATDAHENNERLKKIKLDPTVHVFSQSKANQAMDLPKIAEILEYFTIGLKRLSVVDENVGLSEEAKLSLRQFVDNVSRLIDGKNKDYEGSKEG